MYLLRHLWKFVSISRYKHTTNIFVQKMEGEELKYENYGDWSPQLLPLKLFDMPHHKPVEQKS